MTSEGTMNLKLFISIQIIPYHSPDNGMQVIAIGTSIPCVSGPGKPIVKDGPKDPIKDGPKDIPKDPPKDIPKDIPKDPPKDPCTVADLYATTLHALGLDPETEVYTPGDRPIKLSEGRVLQNLLA